jgi:hypothetical protein
VNKFNYIRGFKDNVGLSLLSQTTSVAAEMIADSRDENVNAADCLATIEALKAGNLILMERNIQLQQMVISLQDEKVELMQDKCTCHCITSTASGYRSKDKSQEI